MKVSLRLFAGLKDVLGRREMDIDVADGSTVGDLKERLAVEFPGVQPLLKTLVFAIDDEYVSFEEKLRDGAEVALIPPVSGGAGPDLDGGLFRVTTEPMQAQELAD